ncbi:MAG: asparaginase domain-containing protein, partial [Oscillospiraceae bacterium]
MRIKVIFTGGTISSSAFSSGLDVSINNEAAYRLISEFKRAYSQADIEFSAYSPLNILSENMTLDYWNNLLNELKRTDFSAFDGIIITHGTDTLGYTAAMLSFMLGGIGIPVVLVSSCYILTDKRSNGQDNFNNAVYFIKNSGLAGVYAIYRNRNGASRVYLGSRLRQCENFTDSFLSVGGVDFGEMKNQVFYPENHSFNPSLEAVKERAASGGLLLQQIKRLLPCVFMISPYTGLDYRNIQPIEKIRAVLHLLYHASTVCVEKGVNSAAEFCS